MNIISVAALKEKLYASTVAKSLLAALGNVNLL